MKAPTATLPGVQNNAKPTSYEAQQSFGSFLKEAINNTNVQQINSDLLTRKLVQGEHVDLHEVMIAAQKASITLNATMEVRNKVVEAYQEIIRMPV
ncbi:flagellar hook-basal body complex protein FliE [Sporosarcina pasteurii]|nr:flagellar hook-basal body complex protein FliE [Sporosarcina pasteurii]MDS9470577.1 flagellar hook-basal body complex protein FliE [Sporosarcina pasteurii]QBQ07104.1 flagellar hook-basal body complex protein FliE [Sporosarcina pasteurii]